MVWVVWYAACGNTSNKFCRWKLEEKGEELINTMHNLTIFYLDLCHRKNLQLNTSNLGSQLFNNLQ